MAEAGVSSSRSADHVFKSTVEKHHHHISLHKTFALNPSCRTIKSFCLIRSCINQRTHTSRQTSNLPKKTTSRASIWLVKSSAFAHHTDHLYIHLFYTRQTSLVHQKRGNVSGLPERHAHRSSSRNIAKHACSCTKPKNMISNYFCRPPYAFK